MKPESADLGLSHTSKMSRQFSSSESQNQKKILDELVVAYNKVSSRYSKKLLVQTFFCFACCCLLSLAFVFPLENESVKRKGDGNLDINTGTPLTPIALANETVETDTLKELEALDIQETNINTKFWLRTVAIITATALVFYSTYQFYVAPRKFGITHDEAVNRFYDTYIDPLSIDLSAKSYEAASRIDWSTVDVKDKRDNKKNLHEMLIFLKADPLVNIDSRGFFLKVAGMLMPVFLLLLYLFLLCYYFAEYLVMNFFGLTFFVFALSLVGQPLFGQSESTLVLPKEYQQNFLKKLRVATDSADSSKFLKVVQDNVPSRKRNFLISDVESQTSYQELTFKIEATCNQVAEMGLGSLESGLKADLLAEVFTHLVSVLNDVSFQGEKAATDAANEGRDLLLRQVERYCFLLGAQSTKQTNELTQDVENGLYTNFLLEDPTKDLTGLIELLKEVDIQADEIRTELDALKKAAKDYGNNPNESNKGELLDKASGLLNLIADKPAFLADVLGKEPAVVSRFCRSLGIVASIAMLATDWDNMNDIEKVMGSLSAIKQGLLLAQAYAIISTCGTKTAFIVAVTYLEYAGLAHTAFKFSQGDKMNGNKKNLEEVRKGKSLDGKVSNSRPINEKPNTGRMDEFAKHLMSLPSDKMSSAVKKLNNVQLNTLKSKLNSLKGSEEAIRKIEELMKAVDKSLKLLNEQ